MENWITLNQKTESVNNQLQAVGVSKIDVLSLVKIILMLISFFQEYWEFDERNLGYLQKARLWATIKYYYGLRADTALITKTLFQQIDSGTFHAAKNRESI